MRRVIINFSTHGCQCQNCASLSISRKVFVKGPSLMSDTGELKSYVLAV